MACCGSGSTLTSVQRAQALVNRAQVPRNGPKFILQRLDPHVRLLPLLSAFLLRLLFLHGSQREGATKHHFYPLQPVCAFIPLHSCPFRYSRQLGAHAHAVI